MSCELVVMSDSEFEKAKNRLKQILTNLRDLAKEAADLLSKMSRPQLSEIKKIYRGIWSADHIDRLVLYGRGRISAHLALKLKTIPASLLRRLPKETLTIINDPENSVDFWTMHGVVSKRVDHLNALDWDQVLDNKGNILSIEKQQKKCLTTSVSKIPINPSDVEVPDQLEVKGKYIFLRGKVTTMQVEIKLLRKFIA